MSQNGQTHFTSAYLFCKFRVLKTSKKKSLWLLFYGWGSTASRLQLLPGGSLLFTIQFPEITGTHFIDLVRGNQTAT